MKYLVIIEWGGKPPPNKWYRRLRALATLSARDGDAGERASDAQDAHLGFVVQEGIILCVSRSLARTIAALATQGIEINGEIVAPSAVLMAEAELVAFKPASEDYRALERLEMVASRRGPRKPKEWVVTCYEEAETVGIRSIAPVACPNCGATHIHHRAGLVNRFADPGGDILTAWVRMRFSNGRWERNIEGGDELPPDTVRIAHRQEHEFVESLKGSPLLSQFDGLSRHRAFQLLDAALIARVHTDVATRLRARMKAATRLLEMGESSMAVGALAEGDVVDMLDVAVVLGADTAATLLVSRISKAEMVAPKVEKRSQVRFVAPQSPTSRRVAAH